MAVVILQPALTAPAKVFNKGAVGRCLSPEGIGEAASRAKYLHRNVVTFAFWRTHFRGIQVVGVAGIIQNQAVGFTRRQTQPPADDLLIQAHRFGRAQNRNQIHVRSIKTGGQDRYVHQIAKLLRFEGFN